MSRILGLACCAVALAAPFAAFGQGSAGWPQGQPILGDGFWANPGIVSEGNSLFRFPSLSNKSGSNCMTGPRKGGGRPKVIATFPAEGAVVRPGLVVVRVTFDQPMSCDASFAGQTDLPNPCPGRWREATLSADRTSFRTVCEVRPNTRYRLTLHSFRNSRGLAMPEAVTFSTSGASPVGTILEALAEDAFAAG